MNQKIKYTHKDSNGVRWRFVGTRPVSELADRVTEQAEEARRQELCKVRRNIADRLKAHFEASKQNQTKGNNHDHRNS